MGKGCDHNEDIIICDRKKYCPTGSSGSGATGATGPAGPTGADGPTGPAGAGGEITSSGCLDGVSLIDSSSTTGNTVLRQLEAGVGISITVTGASGDECINIAQRFGLANALVLNLTGITPTTGSQALTGTWSQRFVSGAFDFTANVVSMTTGALGNYLGFAVVFIVLPNTSTNPKVIQFGIVGTDGATTHRICGNNDVSLLSTFPALDRNDISCAGDTWMNITTTFDLTTNPVHFYTDVDFNAAPDFFLIFYPLTDFS